jgi:hypothetical protein
MIDPYSPDSQGELQLQGDVKALVRSNDRFLISRTSHRSTQLRSCLCAALAQSVVIPIPTACLPSRSEKETLRVDPHGDVIPFPF